MTSTPEKSLTMRDQTASNTASSSGVRAAKRQLEPDSTVEVAVRRQNTSDEDTDSDYREVAVKRQKIFVEDSDSDYREDPVKRQNTSAEDTDSDNKSSSAEDTDGTDSENQITAQDLTDDNPSENYWRKLAKRRRFALKETLKENENLRKNIEILRAEMLKYKQMLDEANIFMEVIKEELATDDTGIDVNDVSAADETAEAGDTAEINETDDTASTADETDGVEDMDLDIEE